MSFTNYEFIFFTLIAAVLVGWFIAKIEYSRRIKNTGFDLPSAYFKGLNYLLNEEPDKAIEVFVQVLEVNSETIETHLALGNLFRKRGEAERAIRIHQNLMARPALSNEQRALALMELGRDYLKAGLYDRAENLFQELEDDRQQGKEVLGSLLQIYEHEKEWKKAINSAKKLSASNGKQMNDVIAQYYCELSDEAIKVANYSVASKLVKQALAADPACVRASLIQGNVEAEQSNHREAIKAWKRIGDQDAMFLGEVADKVQDSFRALGDEEGLLKFFQTALDKHKTISMMLTMSDIIDQQKDTMLAEKFIIEWLRKKPTVHGLYRLIDLSIKKSGENASEDLILLRGIIGELKNEHEGYVCKNCGFKGKVMHWLCPGCHSWNTIRPLSGD
jgi:lipopolysaccharide biosynthesis regulator YciM